MTQNARLCSLRGMYSGKMIKPLHGMRGVAALTVVFGHFAPGGAPALGVVLFFVLSGFLIGKLYTEQAFTGANVWRYVVARFARVYPLFAVVIICTSVLNAFTSAHVFGLDPDEVPKHLALVGSAATVWTISTEFQFYILFILVWALRSRLPSALIAVLPLLVLATAIALWIGTDATRISIFGYLHIFLLGVLTASLTARLDHAWQPVAALAVAVRRSLPRGLCGHAFPLHPPLGLSGPHFDRDLHRALGINDFGPGLLWQSHPQPAGIRLARRNFLRGLSTPPACPVDRGRNAGRCVEMGNTCPQDCGDPCPCRIGQPVDRTTLPRVAAKAWRPVPVSTTAVREPIGVERPLWTAA
ncbi:acyltransferase [Limibaculum sp. M0105]|uniref:Acyltransferase n=1 Tax=Thermohalobaculum xanthum TaxID=2753746 RepID=A0A8J7SD10_9RHOB|nr:acyltransferase [Thermohalobaculum xanthum]MBK0399767.1 acyltransferase [Thermohalobaculum xanthum]